MSKRGFTPLGSPVPLQRGFVTGPAIYGGDERCNSLVPVRKDGVKAPSFLTGFTLTELASIITIIALFIILLSPFIIKLRRKARIIACEENLQKIGLGLKLYASDHNGKFPSSLGELTEGGYVEDERFLDCPSNPHLGDGDEPDYHYSTGWTILSPSDTAIVSDRVENHKSGKHVLYTSGDIVWESK